ncbi:hypothetical protein BO94DRAFT_43067 [Aspergillus sclerotioniger CBS 115572]|uniref:Uncharacterized protein n=1 Tax=Aspergillus sclerotioniger CBS 115572 TaxID=1450535 RepID=A0A317WTA8_9EURO|nr:hypothetical protein BO94DRAFT_43067 [Aspergillus sclerotioniger CBS 115572]PWY89643.1 hypothetical protein BO94DRAFT_43067 [Aspergillus sclerotioniger CBS 115572]
MIHGCRSHHPRRGEYVANWILILPHLPAISTDPESIFFYRFPYDQSSPATSSQWEAACSCFQHPGTDPPGRWPDRDQSPDLRTYTPYFTTFTEFSTFRVALWRWPGTMGGAVRFTTRFCSCVRSIEPSLREGHDPRLLKAIATDRLDACIGRSFVSWTRTDFRHSRETVRRDSCGEVLLRPLCHGETRPPRRSGSGPHPFCSYPGPGNPADATVLPGLPFSEV